MKEVFIKRLLAKTMPEPNSGCWLWVGALNPISGYGNFWLGPKQPTNAHKAAYLLLVGPVPEGLEIDHKCRNRACVNPDHLEPVTHRENFVRGAGPALTSKRLRARTHCKQGHPLDGANLILQKNGKRNCRECCRRIWREFARKKRGVPASAWRV